MIEEVMQHLRAVLSPLFSLSNASHCHYSMYSCFWPLCRRRLSIRLTANERLRQWRRHRRGDVENFLPLLFCRGIAFPQCSQPPPPNFQQAKSGKAQRAGESSEQTNAILAFAIELAVRLLQRILEFPYAGANVQPVPAQTAQSATSGSLLHCANLRSRNRSD